ncbi:major facilitator superfamily protein [Ascobolus immersus RN42]|uniref:Major facilitator superfamily protein n=1 Tax=Ascobolus immersus RN42 TaxID=1160509 RepID=A0A3N4HNH6_ASCIM|nr:major facilitator superfamily protein [Ascobolus immersus RN42]
MDTKADSKEGTYPNALTGENVAEDSESPSSSASSESDLAAPPDGGYGWVVVGACATLNGFTWGVNASYGVYLAHYLQSDQFPEATPTDYAFIGGLNFSIAMLVAPLVTPTAREIGPRKTMFIGVAIQTLGWILASFCKRIWQLYLTQGILIGLGLGFIFIPSIAVMSQWFSKKRSLANGISAAGSGLGGLIWSFLTRAVIDKLGIEWTLRITGIVVCVVNCIATSLMRHRNHLIKPTQNGFDWRLLIRFDMMLLLSWAFILNFGYVTILFSIPDYCTSVGMTKSQASTALAILNLGTALGRPLIGVISDRLGRFEVAEVCTMLVAALSLAMWIPANGFAVTLVYCLLIGAVLGIFWVSVAPLSIEVVGLKELPSALSLSWLAIVLPCTFGEVIALHIRRPENQHPYLYAQLFAALSYLVAGVFLDLLRRVVRKRQREEKEAEAIASSS